jgi:hypothetical protein
MEHHVFLAIRNEHSNRRKAKNEMRKMKIMLQQIESFKSFCDNYEVMDANKRTAIKSYRRLHDIYCYGPDKSTFTFVVSRN